VEVAVTKDALDVEEEGVAQVVAEVAAVASALKIVKLVEVVVLAV